MTQGNKNNNNCFLSNSCANNHVLIYLIIVTCFAFCIRFVCALPVLNKGVSAMMRPDSYSYVAGAKSILDLGTYSNNGDLLSFYPPGYSAFLALIYNFCSTESLVPSIIGIILSALLVPLTYRIAIYFTTQKIACIAATFIALNITIIGMAPLLLSDTLFAFITAYVLLFMADFYKTGKNSAFLIAIALSSISCYVRPVMIMWWVPALFLLWVYHGKSLKSKVLISIIGLLLFFGIQMPWMVRNYVNDHGFAMTSSSGSMYRYNAIVVLYSMKTGEDAETIRTRYRNEDQLMFKNSPDSFKTLASRNQYMMSKVFEDVKKYPFDFFRLHLRPAILLPDVSTFSENLGATSHGGGTFDVLNRNGYWAAVKYYFNGKMWLFYLLLPLVLITFVFYALTLYELILSLYKKRIYLFFFFMGCSYYFLFVPGPVTMPRYQIPALFLISILGAMGAKDFYLFFKRKVLNDEPSQSIN